MLGTIGNSIKKPIVKTFGSTIKNSVSMFRRNTNTIKSFSCGLQKKYLKTSNNFGNKSVKYLREEGIKKFKYITHYATEGSKQLVIRKGRRDIQMRSAEQMHGTQLRSLFNMISKSKPQLPLLFVAGGLDKLTQFNLVPSDNDTDMQDPLGIVKVKQPKEKIDSDKDKVVSGKDTNKQHLDNIQSCYEDTDIELYNTEEDLCLAEKEEQDLLENQTEYSDNNKENISLTRQRYYAKNKDKILENKREYYQSNKDKIIEQKRLYYLKNKEKIAERQKRYREKKKQIEIGEYVEHKN